jgi:hypothetical protein
MTTADGEREPLSTSQEATANVTLAVKDDVVAELRAALRHTDPWVRLHAVSSLARRTSDEALSGLVQALHDESFGVHWAAANALATHGRAGVVAVLGAMLHDEPTTGFLHGAARVLQHASLTEHERQVIAPVLDALHRPAADLEAPVLASVAVSRLAPLAEAAAQPVEQPWWRVRRDRRGLRGHVFAGSPES